MPAEMKTFYVTASVMASGTVKREIVLLFWEENRGNKILLNVK